MKVLIVVDLQNDFISGSLAVKDAEQIVPVINKLIGSGKFDKVVLTQDYHPFQHHSFKSSGHNGIWPDHCIKGTRGVEFHSHLHTQNADLIIRKGTNLEVDSYSGRPRSRAGIRGQRVCLTGGTARIGGGHAGGRHVPFRRSGRCDEDTEVDGRRPVLDHGRDSDAEGHDRPGD